MAKSGSNQIVTFSENYDIIMARWGTAEQWITDAACHGWKDPFQEKVYYFIQDKIYAGEDKLDSTKLCHIFNAFQPIPSKQTDGHISYYQNHGKMMKKLRTSARPGTAFKKIFGFMSQKQIDMLVNWYKELTLKVPGKKFEVILSKEAEHFRSAYCDPQYNKADFNTTKKHKNISYSCIDNNKHNFTSSVRFKKTHPAEVYAAGDLSILIIKHEGKIAGRVILWIDEVKKRIVHGPLYAAAKHLIDEIQTELEKLSKKHGFELMFRDHPDADWYGVRLKKIPLADGRGGDDNKCIIAPFIDVWSRYVNHSGDDPNILVIADGHKSEEYHCTGFSADYHFASQSATAALRRFKCPFTDTYHRPNEGQMFEGRMVSTVYLKKHFKCCHLSGQYDHPENFVTVYKGSNYVVSYEIVKSQLKNCRKVTAGDFAGEYFIGGTALINGERVTTTYRNKNYSVCGHTDRHYPNDEMVHLYNDTVIHYTSHVHHSNLNTTLFSEYTPYFIGSNVPDKVKKLFGEASEKKKIKDVEKQAAWTRETWEANVAEKKLIPKKTTSRTERAVARSEGLT